MNKKITGMARGLAAATIVAFTLTACSDDSSSVSPVNDTSSVQEPLSSDSDTPASNGNIAPTSSESNQDSPASSGNDAPTPASSDNGSPASSDTPASSSDVAPNSSPDVAPASSETDTVNFNHENKCPPGGDCNGDGIPDGIYRPDLEPCAIEDSTMEFYSRIFTCKEGKWVYTPDADDVDPIREVATGAKAEHNNGPAVAPSVVKVKNADGTITFRDDGADIYDFDSVTVGAELAGDTLIAHVEFSDPTKSSFVMGTLTFTVSNAFVDINYLKYDFRGNVKPVREVEELHPCGNNSSCVQCSPDKDCSGMAW